MATRRKGKGLALVIGIERPEAGEPEDGSLAQRRRHAADVEAAFTGRPQPHGTYDDAADGGKVAASTAGYMELGGAAKDGDCDLVAADGGVSHDRGCCNLFEPQPGVAAFACGECTHFSDGGAATAPQPQLAWPRPGEEAA